MRPPLNRTICPPLSCHAATDPGYGTEVTFALLFFSVARRHSREGPSFSIAVLRFGAGRFCFMNPQRNGKLCCAKKSTKTFLSARYRVTRASGPNPIVKKPHPPPLPYHAASRTAPCFTVEVQHHCNIFRGFPVGEFYLYLTQELNFSTKNRNESAVNPINNQSHRPALRL